MLISVHKSAIVGITFIYFNHPSKYDKVKVNISNMFKVWAKMLTPVFTSATVGIKSLNLTNQAKTTELKKTLVASK